MNTSRRVLSVDLFVKVMPVVKTIAYNFVTERCPGEVMALGINSIREMAKRIPSLLEEEGMDTLVVVSYCVEYP